MLQKVRYLFVFIHRLKNDRFKLKKVCFPGKRYKKYDTQTLQKVRYPKKRYKKYEDWVKTPQKVRYWSKFKKIN